jgi:hypothetical protein
MFSFSCPLPCETECSKELSHPYQDILEDFDKHLIVEAQSVAKEQFGYAFFSLIGRETRESKKIPPNASIFSRLN